MTEGKRDDGKSLEKAKASGDCEEPSEKGCQPSHWIRHREVSTLNTEGYNSGAQ